MAAYKPEVLISQLVDEIEESFQGLPTFSGWSNSTVLSSIILDIRGIQKFKMAAYKPEVLISHLVDGIETPFQGLPLIFGVEQFFWQLRKWGVALKWRLYLCLQAEI